MNEEKKKFSPPAVGGSSLLVIFAVLCLTIFALLSMSTVQADKRLSDASAQAVEDYYDADAAAEAILAQLRSGALPEGVTLSWLDDPKDYIQADYTCQISRNQALQVSVILDDMPGEVYKILSWQEVFTGSWDPDDKITVWDGKTP